MNLSIVGGSGAGRSLIHLCQRLGFSIDCIYDNRLLVQSKIDGIPCVGNFQSIAFQSTDLFSTCIGSVNSIHRRDKMISALGIPYSQFPLIKSTTSISESSVENFGNGTILFDFVFIGYNCNVSDFCIFNHHVYFGHDSSISSYSILAPGVMVAGNVSIGSRCYLGINATVKDHVSICDDVVIGSGANVTKDITTPGIYVGNPAKLCL